MKNWMWLILPLLAAAGCAHSPRPTTVPAETVAADPRRDTDKARALNEQAVALVQKDKFDDAAKLLRDAQQADIMFGPAHNNLGKVLYHQGDLYHAAWEFEYAAKLMPHQPEPLNNLGLVFEATGKLDQAIQRYSAALTLEPDNPELLGNTARARIRRGDRDPEIREMLSKLIARDTRPEWVEWAKRNLNLMGRTKEN